MSGAHASSRRRWRWIASAVALLVLGAAAAGASLVQGPGASEGASPSPPPSSLVPSPSPSPSPPASSAAGKKERKEERRGTIVISGTGDVNVDPNYIPTFRSKGYDYAWSGLRNLFRKDDLTVINLECPVSTKGRIVPKEFNFRCDPKALPAMRKAGIEVANQGNNHAYDFGPEALVDSLRNLDKAKITPVGAGGNQEEALKAALFEVKGWKVAVVGLDHVVDPYPTAVAGPDHPGTAAGHSLAAMSRAIKAAERQADLVVVTIHWGVELDTRPRDFQVAMAHRFVKAGADVVFGHHAHRLQPLSRVKGVPVFWGLGNFVWPNFSAAGSRTAVAQVTVRPNGSMKAKRLPAYIEAPGHPVLR